MDRNKVVLVDENDHPLAEMDKLEAHQKGLLHRAFSIFIFNSKGEILLQQRAQHKYHGAGLWTNACCSHPQWDENITEAAVQRLEYEMGLQCELKHLFSFTYNTPVENNLIENEYDYVWIGYTDDEPDCHPDEVQDYRWIDTETLQKLIVDHSEIFTYWFKMVLSSVLANIRKY